FFALSIATATAPTHAASAIGGFAREPHVFPKRQCHRVPIRSHRIPGQRVAFPGFRVDTTGGQSSQGSQSEKNEVTVHGFLAMCFSSISSMSLINAVRFSTVRSPL